MIILVLVVWLFYMYLEHQYHRRPKTKKVSSSKRGSAADVIIEIRPLTRQ